ncbi:MAG: large conductance mechanosensitive channel protein MscL [Parasporobacterium sp.]|nr:large conductance mechanosensitive channel protein MscL [Parasporobacterium sp.]
MKTFMKEFKEFINRGNVMDMAVGIIIGGAFTAIVNSLVDDIINPLIGSIFKMDFTSLVANVNGAEVKYGAFIMAIINFILIAIVLFIIIKSINKMSKIGKKEEAPAEEAPTTKVCPFCKSEVPIDATKCCHCTSDLPEEEPEAAE